VSADSNGVFLFDHSLSALAQILLHCAAYWANPTKFAGTFHMTPDNVANILNHLSSVFRIGLSHFCHISKNGSGQRSSRTHIIIIIIID